MVGWQLYLFTRLRAGDARHAFEPRQLPSKPCRPRWYSLFYHAPEHTPQTEKAPCCAVGLAWSEQDKP